MCLHTTICVSAYYYLQGVQTRGIHTVLVLLHVSAYIHPSPYYYMCRHPTIYVSPYHYTRVPRTTSCVLILLYVCPHTTVPYPHATTYRYRRRSGMYVSAYPIRYPIYVCAYHYNRSPCYYI